MRKDKIMKYVSIVFIVSFFIYISVAGLKECYKKEEPIIEHKDIDTNPFDFTESADHGIWRKNFQVKELCY